MMEVSSRTSEFGGEKEGFQPERIDVLSSEGLTTLLKAARNADLDPEASAALRDTVLAYAAGGGTDSALRADIMEQAQSLRVQTSTADRVLPVTSPGIPVGAVSESGVKKQETTQRLATPKILTRAIRPKPHFGNVATVKKSDTPSIHIHTEKTPSAPLRDDPEKDQSETLLPVEESPRVEDHIVGDAPKKEGSVGTIIEESVPPAIVHEAPQSLEEAKNRIAEIKRAVNARVGNPVMLMGAGNTIGKEYMRALVAAMKAVSGAAPGTLGSAMEALEAQYAKLMKLSPEVPQKSEQPESPPHRAGDVSRASIEEEEIAAPLTSSEDPTAGAAPAVSPESEPTPTPAPSEDPIGEPAPVPEDEVKSAEVTPLEPSTAIPSLADEQDTDVFHTAQPASSSELSIETEPARVSEAPAPQNDSVEVSAPRVQEQSEQTVGEDLYAQEITNGLEQLLSEWKIFQSSGMFGVGAGGTDHPLYKKIAPLPMSIVIAGTWDGAKKEAIFSIRDYTTGWLQEQGVSYLPEESFDHYLRRVVKRILRRKAG